MVVVVVVVRSGRGKWRERKERGEGEVMTKKHHDSIIVALATVAQQLHNLLWLLVL
jgi:hypothetical protein